MVVKGGSPKERKSRIDLMPRWYLATLVKFDWYKLSCPLKVRWGSPMKGRVRVQDCKRIEYKGCVKGSSGRKDDIVN